MKFPFSTNTPLSTFPYNSRVSKNEFETLMPAKNYVLCAFNPGNSLQASELNEIQESFYKNLTLHNILLKNWLFIGDSSFTSGSSNLPLYGPSWAGAVPLKPSSVFIEGNVVTFHKDWYLVDDASGLKFWIYNNTILTQTITLPPVSIVYVGIQVSTKYIAWNTTGGIGDTTLLDNSDAYGGTETHAELSGADRYKINIDNTYEYTSSNTAGGLRPIIYRDTTGKYRFLNNLLINQEG